MAVRYRENNTTFIIPVDGACREDVDYGASFGAGGISNSAGLELVGPAGGWVFYDRGSYTTDTWGTWRYLECSPNYTDSSTGGSTEGFTRWGRREITTGAVYGADGYNASGAPAALSTDGLGLQNSYRMWAVDQNRSYFSAYNPAEATNTIAYCFGLSAGGYSDWYLPSRGEQYYIWWNLISNRVAGSNSGRGANAHGASKGFTSFTYWSSNESSATPAFDAWVLDFGNGSRSEWTKHTIRRVRAVRRF